MHDLDFFKHLKILFICIRCWLGTVSQQLWRAGWDVAGIPLRCFDGSSLVRVHGAAWPVWWLWVCGECSLCCRPKDLDVVYTCMLLAPCPAFQLENVSRVSGAYCNWSNSHFPPQGAADVLQPPVGWSSGSCLLAERRIKIRGFPCYWCAIYFKLCFYEQCLCCLCLFWQRATSNW